MQIRDILFLLLLALVGYFLWKKIQQVATLATANQTSTAALSGRVDSLTESNRSLSIQVSAFNDAPDYVATLDALLNGNTTTVNLPTTTAQD